MRLELKRVDPMRAANIMALVYGISMTVMAAVLVPFIMIIGLAAAQSEAQAVGMAPMIIMLVMYPIFGLVFGWLGGLLSAAIYNVIIKLTGGMLLDFETHAAPPAMVPMAPMPGPGSSSTST